MVIRSQHEGPQSWMEQNAGWTDWAGGDLSGITTSEECSALWGAWWLEVSANPIPALCLVVKRGSPAFSSLLKGLLFPRLPLTFLISEKSCLLGWRVRNGFRKEELFGNLSVWFWGKEAEWERGVMAICRLYLDSLTHTLCRRQTSVAHQALPSWDCLPFSPASEVSKTDLWKSSNHGPALPSSVSVYHGWPFLSKDMCPHTHSHRLWPPT